MNQVEINAQWEEAVKRESRGRVLKEHFDFNPKRLNVITEKPTNLNRLNMMAPELKDTHGDDEDTKLLKQKLAVLTNVPKKKYPYPMTTSQELGWDTEMFATHKPKYAFNRKMFAETKYVADFVQCNGKNPLVKDKPVVADPAKK